MKVTPHSAPQNNMNRSLASLHATPAKALAAAKPLTASSAHLHSAIAGQRFDAISFEGTVAMSIPFSATLYVMADLDSA
jgi:hypothetical protein